MEKYYDLVNTLVKNHRKYSEYAEISEEIISDVMNRAKAICSSINDESIISSYLVKLVSTSMITVPKQLGFVPERRTIIPSSVIETLPVKNEIEIAPSVSATNDLEQTENCDGESEEYIDLNDSPDEIVITENNQEFSQKTTDYYVDKSLVDRMINETGSDDLEVIELEDDLIDDDLAYSIDEEHKQEEFADEQIEYAEEIENLVESDEEMSDNSDDGIVVDDRKDVPDELTASEEFNDLDESEDIVEVIETDNLEVVEVENSDISGNLTEDLSSDNELLNEEITEDMQEELSLDFDDTDNTEELLPLEQESDLIEDFEGISTLIEDGIVSELQAETNTESDTKSINYNIPDYSYFEYKQSDLQEEFDENLYSDIIALDSKHPEMQIISICKLKYHESKSVGEIAEILGLSKDDVINSLNEILYLVKD